MKIHMKYIDNLPFLPLIFMASILAILPYPREEIPHSIEKLQMLFSGILIKPLDIFDLLMHTGLIIVLLIKIYRFVTSNKKEVV